MDSLFVATACLLLGVVLKRLGRLPEGADRSISGVVIQLSAPAVCFLAARTMPISLEMLLPASMAWVIFIGGMAFFGLARRVFGFSRETFGCLMLTASLSNVIFIGLPMIEAFYGHELTYVAFLCDSLGTSLVLALPGVLLATHLSPLKRGSAAPGKRVWQALRRVISFPPFQALVLGLALRGAPLPEWLLAGLRHIGMTLVPLSLFAVGLGLSLRPPRGSGKPLMLGLAYKLVLAPLLMLGVAVFLFGNTGPVAQVTIFEAAMPPMVLGGILATENDLDPKLASLLISVGTPLSFLTLPLWRWLLALL
ncbi:MAG: AEC family transporter [Desulfovibrio sp.]|jgi:predicted permease